jgi:membrane protein required for colicin V production
MDGFTIVDAAVAGIVLLSAILAYSRGLVREVMAILGWVVAGVAAFLLVPAVEPLMGEVPVIGPTLEAACEIRIVAAFAIVFVLGLVVLAVFTPLLSGAVQASPLGGIDRALGFLFGVARGIVLVAVALVLYDFFADTGAIEAVDRSRTIVAFATLQDQIAARIPETAPAWIERDVMGLMAQCEA